MKVDILAIAAHPDDAELGCSGTIIKHINLGYKVGILDLTRGELGTRGTPEIRAEEAATASKLMGIHVRENCNFSDGFFTKDKEHLLQLISKIRKFRPEIVFANAESDRHVDHGRASDLIEEACFLSGLKKIETNIYGSLQESWRPKAIYHYIQDRFLKPDVVVDISDQFEEKMAAIMCFKSQFYSEGNQEPDTPISSKQFLEFLKGRATEFGRLINVNYGEGFTVRRSIGSRDLLQLL